MTDEELGQIALDLANEIEGICRGKPSVSVYCALSMMLGASAARAERPDFHGMLRIVQNQAWASFCEQREMMRNG